MRSPAIPTLPEAVARRVRALDLAPTDGSPRFVSAASGLVACGDFLHVVADDELALASFAADDVAAPGTLSTLWPGALPEAHDARKAAKPDLEALALIHGVGGQSVLLGVPSGSRPQRVRGFAWPVTARGALRGAAQDVDFRELFTVAATAVPVLNVEGAAVVDDELWLLQRGSGAGSFNAILALDLVAIAAALARKTPLPGGALRRVLRVDLPALDGVPLGITDAAALPSGGGIVITAAAERTDDPYLDGVVTGSVLGRIDRDGRVGPLARFPGPTKLEGVAVVAERGSALDLRLVSDADDRAIPATLFAALWRAAR
jgi:hypothetical protein